MKYFIVILLFLIITKIVMATMGGGMDMDMDMDLGSGGGGFAGPGSEALLLNTGGYFMLNTNYYFLLEAPE